MAGLVTDMSEMHGEIIGVSGTCRRGLIAHVRECGVGGRMRVIDVCAGVDIDDRPTSLLHADKA